MSRSSSSKSTLIHVAPVNSESSDIEVLSMGEVENQEQERSVQFAADYTGSENPQLRGEPSYGAGRGLLILESWLWFF